MKNGVKDIVSGLCLIGVVGVVVLGITAIPSSGLGGAGAKLVPIMIAASLTVLAALIVIEGKNRLGEPAREKKKADPREKLPVRLTFAVLALYVIAIEPIGFPVATFLYLVAQMYILSRFDAGRILRFIVISGVGTAAIYLVFRTYFHVLLPQGILG